MARLGHLSAPAKYSLSVASAQHQTLNLLLTPLVSTLGIAMARLHAVRDPPRPPLWTTLCHSCVIDCWEVAQLRFFPNRYKDLHNTL